MTGLPKGRERGAVSGFSPHLRHGREGAGADCVREVAVRFEGVWKSFPSYYHVTGGIKSVLFHIGTALMELRQRRSALEDVSFEIFKGESFGFVGRNGAGKSTTLGLIAGVLSPDRGAVTVNGRVSPLLELGAGFHPELSGRENIMLNGVLMGLTRAEVREQIERIIAFAELEASIDQPVRTYSSGMFSKLGFAVVANLKPEILLLDEILSVGDIAFARKCEETFETFRSNREVTMVLVSHSLESVARVCDRAAWVEGRSIRMLGPADEVVRAYVEANTPKCAVAAEIVDLPRHVRAGRAVLDCSSAPARLDLAASWAARDLRFILSLHAGHAATPLQRWECSPGAAVLSLQGEEWELTSVAGGEEVRCMPQLPRSTVWNPCEPLKLRLEGRDGSGNRSEPAWLAVLPSLEAGAKWREQRGLVLNACGVTPEVNAPLWPDGTTLRVVARSMLLHEDAGNFVLGVAGLATRSGLPTRLYAYDVSPELAGIIAPIGDLWAEVASGDTVLFSWSMEDEFLPQVAGLACHKILYFHNIPSGEWFREYDPAYAALLDHSRRQFALFGAFASVLADSKPSLEEIAPHLGYGTPSAVCAPCMDPLRLARLEPEAVHLPEASSVWLWVGHMAPHKRPDDAISLFCRHLPDAPGDLLVMVCAGRRNFPAYAQRIRELMDRLSERERERIIMLEDVSDEQRSWLYRTADVFLYTGVHEDSCLSVLEARAFGLDIRNVPHEAIPEACDGSLGIIRSASFLINFLYESMILPHTKGSVKG